MKTELEDKFASLWKLAKGPEPVREYRFCPGRRWKADFAFPDAKVLVEIEGGVWLGRKGRHTNPKGFIADCDKYNTATLMGYAVIRLTGEYLNPEYISKLVEFIDTRRKYISLCGYVDRVIGVCDTLNEKKV